VRRAGADRTLAPATPSEIVPDRALQRITDRRREEIPMLSLKEILLAFLLPGCIAGAILLAAAHRSRAGTAARGWNEVAGACAFGIAYLVAHSVLLGWPALPSAERTLSALEWQAWSVATIVPASLVFLSKRTGAGAECILRGVFASALVLLSLRGWMQRAGSPGLALSFLVVILVAWASTDALVRRSPGPIAVLPLFATLFCASVSSLLGHSVVVAELAGVVCMALGVSAVVSAIEPSFQLSRGAVAVIVLLFAGLSLNGVFFGDVPWYSGLLSAVSLLAPWIAARRTSSPGSRWKTALLRAALAAIPAAAAVAATYLGTPSYED
jgi:hypothetical protein